MFRKLFLIVMLCVFVSACTGKRENVAVFSQIVREMGYIDAEETPAEIVGFTIPEVFDAVYERYNALQKEGGFDLSLYKGKVCTRYTYHIPSANARANIIVHNGDIIGGDISSITIDGIMIPIQKEKAAEKH